MSKNNEIALDIDIFLFEKLNTAQQQAVTKLQSITFTDVNDEEADLDFYHPNSAEVLAFHKGKLVGWAGIHQTEQKFEGRKIKIGGYGICTHPDWQGKGIGSKVSRRAMVYLAEKGAEVGFLSVDPNSKASIRIHEKNGFVMLPRKFVWTNSLGETKRSDGAMIAPINSKELFEKVLNSQENFYIGNGYW